MKKIKYLVMDVDGTLTDGKLYIGPKGEEFKAFNIKDGAGIAEILPLLNITPVIITGRNSEIVQRRCEELKITAYVQGAKNKLNTLKEIVKDLGTVAYMGDDLNDLECMQCVKEAGGIVGTPKDAADEIINIADFVSKKKGGNGAVRDFIEYLAKGNF